MNKITNVAARAENVVELPSPPAIAYLDGAITAYTF